MFELFRKRKKKPATNTGQEKIVSVIVSKAIRLQERWAAFMQRKTERLSLRSKKYIIVLFCIAAGGNSVYVTIESFATGKKKIVTVTNIKTPKHLTRTGEENFQPIIIITESEFKKIHSFRAYMDSLNKSVAG